MEGDLKRKREDGFHAVALSSNVDSWRQYFHYEENTLEINVCESWQPEFAYNEPKKANSNPSPNCDRGEGYELNEVVTAPLDFSQCQLPKALQQLFPVLCSR
jgi:hypothetical protein